MSNKRSHTETNVPKQHSWRSSKNKIIYDYSDSNFIWKTFTLLLRNLNTPMWLNWTDWRHVYILNTYSWTLLIIFHSKKSFYITSLLRNAPYNYI